jgi:O-antigen/teichoic acid export membrane protein
MKIGQTILLLFMITVLTFVGFACVSIAEWGIIGYAVISLVSFVALIWGLIFIWVYKDKRNIITKKEVTK